MASTDGTSKYLTLVDRPDFTVIQRLSFIKGKNVLPWSYGDHKIFPLLGRLDV